MNLVHAQIEGRKRGSSLGGMRGFQMTYISLSNSSCFLYPKSYISVVNNFLRIVLSVTDTGNRLNNDFPL